MDYRIHEEVREKKTPNIIQNGGKKEEDDKIATYKRGTKSVKQAKKHSPSFHIHVSVSDLYHVVYFQDRSLLILQQENVWIDPGNI